MRRRGFLAVSVLGSGAVAVGCGAAHGHPVMPEAEANELAARLTRGMRMLSDRPFGSLVSGPPESRPDLREQVLRLTMESLLVLDVLRAIPENTAVPASLAEVLAPMLPRLDRAIHTNHALLSRMPEASGRRLDARLRAHADLPMDVAAWLDARSAEVGVPADNRMRLRHSAMTLGTRIRRQSTNAVVRDCVAKLDEAIVRQTPLPADLAATTGRVVDVLWRQVDESSDQWGSAVSPADTSSAPRVSSSTGDPMMVPQQFGAGAEMDEPTEPVQWSASWARPGDEEIRLGAILMPLGLITCGITLIVGLVILAVGLEQNGGWDGRSHEHD